MKGLLIFTVGLVAGLVNAHAQEPGLQRTSIVTSAGSKVLHQSNDKRYLIGYSIGQNSPVKGLQNGRLHLLQGFQHFLFSAPLVIAHQKQVSVYPNPTDGELTVRWLTSPPQEEIIISLISADGKTVRKDRVIPIGEQLTIDYAQIARGAYVLELIGKSGNYPLTKIILQ